MVFMDTTRPRFPPASMCDAVVGKSFVLYGFLGVFGLTTAFTLTGMGGRLVGSTRHDCRTRPRCRRLRGSGVVSRDGWNHALSRLVHRSTRQYIWQASGHSGHHVPMVVSARSCWPSAGFGFNAVPPVDRFRIANGGVTPCCERGGADRHGCSHFGPGTQERSYDACNACWPDSSRFTALFCAFVDSPYRCPVIAELPGVLVVLRRCSSGTRLSSTMFVGAVSVMDPMACGRHPRWAYSQRKYCGGWRR